MRVLNVEDDVFKHNQIKSALRQLNITDITWLENENDAVIDVLENEENNTPYDLIISDMQFPLFSGGRPDDDAGMTFIDELQGHKITIPIIVCSSFRLSIPSILGCVHYSDKTDLVLEFRNLINKI